MSITKAKRKNVNVSFTLSEIHAILETSINMKDDLDYFDFKPKKEFKLFCNAYFSAINKLIEAKDKLHDNSL